MTENKRVERAIDHMINDIKTPLARILSIDEHYNLSANNLTDDYVARSAANVIRLNARKIEQIINDIIDLEKVRLKEKKPPIIIELLNGQGKIGYLDLSQPEQKWLKEIERYVEKNMTSVDLKLSDIAYQVAVSERQLYRKIRKLLGITPNEYVKKLRLHRAKHLIENKLYSTTLEIARRVGYQDAHYFKKVYSTEYP